MQSILESSSIGGGDVSRKTLVSTPGWPSLPGREDDSTEPLEPRPPVTIRIASSMGRMCGATYHYTSTLFSARKQKGNSASSSATPAHASSNAKTAMTKAEEKEAKRVMIGRWIWISSAVIGIIGTAFASGLLAIEFSSGEEEEGQEQLQEGLSADTAKDGEVLDAEATKSSDDEEEYELVLVDGEDDDDDDEVDDDDEDADEVETEEEFEFEEDE